MDTHRAAWNKHQHALQAALSHPVEHPEWLALFLDQHAQVHSSSISQVKTWSFEDEVLDGISEAGLRSIPPKMDHSIAWILWHLARCEDVTINILVGGSEQVYENQGWKEKIHAPIDHTGNEIDLEEVIQFSQIVDLENLKAYRQAVCLSTRQVVCTLSSDDLNQKVEPLRISKVHMSGAVIPAANSIVNYWSKRTIAGLLLMPPTRHCFTHLNEAMRVKTAYLSVEQKKNKP